MDDKTIIDITNLDAEKHAENAAKRVASYSEKLLHHASILSEKEYQKFLLERLEKDNGYVIRKASDIHLQRGNTVLIIDAKYYSHTTQSQFDKHTIHSNNLYQIFTYVKNRSYQFGEEKNTVSGMLLYAKTEEEIQPDNVYQMHGSQISVKTLDLNQPFAEIANQMDRIVESHFSGLAKKY